MADLKPLGSEKLSGDDKLKRILELTYYNNSKKTQTNNKAELVKESKNGGLYGIVKEKDGYYVKRGLSENSLDYIGGMFMKNKNKFNSYAEALKRLELLKGQEELNEATKYVLKTNSPKEEAAPEAPISDVPSDPVSDTSLGDDPSAEPAGELPPPSPESGEESAESKRSDYMAEVQKFAGKLGQELRDQQEKMESDDIKYVLNMVISAVNLDKLDLEDLEEIGKKFEREEDVEGDQSSEEPSSEEEPSSDESVPSEEPSSEDELGEVDGLASLEELINTPLDQNEVNVGEFDDLSEDDIKEIDIEEMKHEINQAIGEKLSKYFN
jgi:hypothetical protein